MTNRRLPPGPVLPAAIQALMWAYRFPEFTTGAHRRFGPTFTARIGGLPPGIVTIERDVVRRLFTGDPSKKRHANDLLRVFLGSRSVLLLEPGEHIQRRKLITPPFHGKRVAAYAALMEQLIEAELDSWRAGTEVTVLPVAQRLTLEVILRAVLGIGDPEMASSLRSLFDAMLQIPGTDVLVYYPSLHGRDTRNPVAKRYWSQHDALAALLDEQIARTRSDPRLADRDDILAMLVQARTEEGEQLTDADLRDELNTLIAAGHETTATSIAWGAELLAHNPAVAHEARRADDEGAAAYLDALAKEVLRIRPPVPIGGARQPVEPFQIDDWTVNPGEAVLVNAYGIHHDPENHPDPGRFRPERFLEPTPEYSFVTFGGGAHRCVGAALAQLELKVVLSAVLRRFDLEPMTDALAPAVRRAITLIPKGGGRVRLAPPATGRRYAPDQPSRYPLTAARNWADSAPSSAR